MVLLDQYCVYEQVPNVNRSACQLITMWGGARVFVTRIRDPTGSVWWSKTELQNYPAMYTNSHRTECSAYFDIQYGLISPSPNTEQMMPLGHLFHCKPQHVGSSELGVYIHRFHVKLRRHADACRYLRTYTLQASGSGLHLSARYDVGTSNVARGMWNRDAANFTICRLNS